MKFSYNSYKASEDSILAISDAELLGKTFAEGELRLSVPRDFYGGGTCGEKDALALIKGATIVNAVGKGIVSLLRKEKLISECMVLVVSGVPHAQIIAIR